MIVELLFWFAVALGVEVATLVVLSTGLVCYRMMRRRD